MRLRPLRHILRQQHMQPETPEMTSDPGSKWPRRAFLAGSAAMIGAPALSRSKTPSARSRSDVDKTRPPQHLGLPHAGLAAVFLQPRQRRDPRRHRFPRRPFLERGRVDLQALPVLGADDRGSDAARTHPRGAQGRGARLAPDTVDARTRSRLPAYVPPGPNNPLGTHALYLSWTYYRIHGTHDTRKIGRRSSSGCVGLYNQHIRNCSA